MSDITINVCATGDASSRRAPTGDRRKRKDKWFLKKMRYVERKGCLQEKHKHNHRRGHTRHNQTLHQNEAFADNPSLLPSAQNRNLPHPGRVWPMPSASSHSLPSLTVNVLNQSTGEKPKGPLSAGSVSTGPGGPVASSHKPTVLPASQASAGLPTKYVAIDCEMVGTGPKGRVSQLARCSIVSYEGDVVYDKYINPSMPVTDYRTRWSGIRRCDLVKATPYSEARKEILRLLMGKVVIGHAIHNDFKALGYSHPTVLTRDTSRIPPLNRRAGFAENECASLKRLTKAIFNREIQTGRKGHSSVEDARATMELYRVVEAEWERTLASK